MFRGAELEVPGSPAEVVAAVVAATGVVLTSEVCGAGVAEVTTATEVLAEAIAEEPAEARPLLLPAQTFVSTVLTPVAFG